MPPKFYVGQIITYDAAGSKRRFKIISIDKTNDGELYHYRFSYEKDNNCIGFLYERNVKLVYDYVEDGPITYR